MVDPCPPHGRYRGHRQASNLTPQGLTATHSHSPVHVLPPSRTYSITQQPYSSASTAEGPVQHLIQGQVFAGTRLRAHDAARLSSVGDAVPRLFCAVAVTVAAQRQVPALPGLLGGLLREVSGVVASHSVTSYRVQG